MIIMRKKRKIRPGFEFKGTKIPINRLVPTKTLPTTVLQSAKYKQTEISIREIGIIEPPIVFREQDDQGNYLLLDGHMRVQILENMGHSDVFCLIAKDDESYTYNKMVNRINNIQEHHMIRKALDRGVSEEDLARHLGVNVQSIKNKKNLLKGICKEVVEMFQKRDIPISTFAILRRFIPFRQMQVAEVMIGANNFSEGFAQALFAATPQEQRAEEATAKKSFQPISLLSSLLPLKMSYPI
uniref:RepB plasmid partition n=1 Tax=Magnetococcus massalia (strain MO-1) TaxID=451514 RepID=A0A1S7LJI6_MAGMO